MEGVGPDLFSEINLPEMQKLRQQLIQVSLHPFSELCHAVKK
jgi:hypothetical protein